VALLLHFFAAMFQSVSKLEDDKSIALQIQLIRCLSQPIRPARSFGFVDPIGSHRPALMITARQLRVFAKELEGWSGGSGITTPFPIVLRGVAREIEAAISERSSLVEGSVRGIMDMLMMTVAALAGSRDLTVAARLADRVHAFDGSGHANTDLIVAPVVGKFTRLMSGTASALERTSDALKALLAIAAIVIVLVLVVRGRMSLSALSGWNP